MSTRARASGPERLSRFEPSRPSGPPPIDRPRLLALLAERFERRLTLVVAPAGFGKTTLLAQSLVENEREPRGIDVWLGCGATDEAESALADGLLDALDHDGTGGDRLNAVVDAVWARAPQEVALVIDDAHLVGEGSTGAAFVAALVDALPANGHLVLASRVLPSFPLARLRATGEVAVLGEEDLAFDASELARFADERQVDIAVVDRCGGWPALAEFQSQATTPSDDPPWNELLAAIGPVRSRALVRLAPFADVDDELVRVVTGLDLTAVALVEGLPLVGVGTAGVRMHDLWRDALLEGRPAEADEGVRAGAGLLQARGRPRAGFDALDRAGDVAALEDFVTAFARTDFPEASAEDLRHILKGLPESVAAGGYGTLLRGAMLLGEDSAAAAVALVEAGDLLASAGDHEGEAVALVRRVMVAFWQADLSTLGPVLMRLRELADQGIARAVRSVELSDAYGLLIAGRPAEAIDRVVASGASSDAATAPLASFLVAAASLDLGHPARTLQEAAHTLPTAVGRTRAGLLGLQLEARCLQGLPGEADYRAWATELDDAVRELGVVENIVLLAAGGALMELRFGRAEAAARLVEEARLGLPATVGPRARAALGVAEAAALVEAGDEAAAARRLAAQVEDVPLGDPPDRAYLRTLPMVHLLVPGSRPVLDGADLGPVWMTARRVAHALLAVRDGELGSAAELDWDRPEPLRAVALPRHLAELAVAAAAGGNDRAATVLADLPIDVRAALRPLSERGGALAETAGAFLRQIAAPPSASIEIRVLGPLEVHRGGALVDDAGWRRERVRVLLAHLVANRSMSQVELAAALWPDRDERAGANNLRVNLSHLQKVLQPDREPDEPPAFVRVSDDRIDVVASDHLLIDVDEFERHLRAGREADERGVPGMALDRLLQAVDEYRGEYLAELEDLGGVEFDRVRLRSGFVAAAVRAGELLLGSGEHLRALALATRATEVEPMDEAAHRLRSRAAAVAGDREGAAAMLDLAVARIRAAGLEPEPETIRHRAELAATG